MNEFINLSLHLFYSLDKLMKSVKAIWLTKSGDKVKDFGVHTDSCGTYPEFVVVVKCIEQLDYVAMVTFSQDVNLHHVVFQLIFTLCLDHFGCS